MKIIKLLLAYYLLALSQFNVARADVIVHLTEEPPQASLPPVSQLPLAEAEPVLIYNKNSFATPFGTITVSGGYIGEGPNNYKMTATLTCKDGRHIKLFNLKFCDFKKNPRVLKDNFEVNIKTNTVRFNYLASKRPTESGDVECFESKVKDVQISCDPR